MKTNLPFSNNRLHGEYRKNSRMISDSPNQHFFFRKNPLPGNGIATGHTGTEILPSPHHETFPTDTSHDPDKNGVMKNMPYCFHPVCQFRKNSRKAFHRLPFAGHQEHEKENHMKKVDAIIIGFGKGGKTLAADLAKRGWKVAMIERNDGMYGGTCINIGCIPTKTLIHQASETACLTHGDKDAEKRHYREAIEKKNALTAMLRDRNYHNLADDPNITVYHGEGRFISTDAVSVALADGGTLELTSKHIFINTGARSVIPPIEGVRESRHVYTSTTIMQREKLPDNLVIIGGGYIGLEFAAMFAAFGSRVTVLDNHSDFIPKEDRDIAVSVKAVMEKKGVEFRMNARTESIRDTENGVRLSCHDTEEGYSYEIEADAVLLATGRRPETTALDLAAAKIETDRRGAIVVDSRLKTSNPYVRAIGDVRGGPQFTCLSLDDYRIIRDDLFGNHDRNTDDRTPFAYTVFIDPPLSRTGTGEDEARAMGMDIGVVRLPAASVPRARTLEAPDGLLKAVIDRKTGKILGATLFCAESGEVINLIVMAMKTGQPYTFLRDFIFTHPSMSEALNDLMNQPMA